MPLHAGCNAKDGYRVAQIVVRKLLEVSVICKVLLLSTRKPSFAAIQWLESNRSQPNLLNPTLTLTTSEPSLSGRAIRLPVS